MHFYQIKTQFIAHLITIGYARIILIYQCLDRKYKNNESNKNANEELE